MAQDIFLKLDGISGESQKEGVKDWIEVFSFSNGATNHSTVAHGTGSGAGKVDITSVSFQKTLDKSSPNLFLNCAKGTHIAKGSLIVRESTGDKTTKTYFQYDFKEIFIDSISWGAAANAGKPAESVSMSFNEIMISYSPQSGTGSLGAPIMAGWNLSTNKQA